METLKNRQSGTHVTQLPGLQEEIFLVTLRNDGIEIGLTNIGCSVVFVRTPDKDGVVKNIVAGLADLDAYKINRDYFGCVVGRYANRIADGLLSLNGRVYQLSLNDPPNHLHGGFQGFGHKTWKLEEVSEEANCCGVVFSYCSVDGEEGYPGNLQVKVKYRLHGSGRFEISYRAVTDQATPVNLTNHSYFNLSGFGQDKIYDHRLKINAEKYTEKTARNTSSGCLPAVKGTALDFTQFRRIGDGIDQFPADMGYDHNFVLDAACKDLSIPAATLTDAASGRIVHVYTDQPGIQFYSGNYWDGTVRGEQGFLYQQHGGVALETQAWPGSVQHPHFPNTILQPGEEYRTTTIFEFLTVS
jgi:aldose 1-epimerase